MNHSCFGDNLNVRPEDNLRCKSCDDDTSGVRQMLRRLPGENRLVAFFFILSLGFISRAHADHDEVITNFTQADSNIGERLFLETRFSRFFFASSGGDANFQLTDSDPVMDVLETVDGPVAGPFAAPSMGAMNCRQCHLVDEKGYGALGDNTLGNRTYADFASHSAIPAIGDGRTHTPRNSPTLVESLATSQTPRFFESGFIFSPTSNFDALMPGQPPLFLHRDGQFASAHDLIIGTLTGRNYGWRPTEYAIAIAHIAHIIRDDDGSGYLASEGRDGQFNAILPGLSSYRNIFSGYANYRGDPRFIQRFLISPQYRLDMTNPKTTDDRIIQTVAALIQVYLESLIFSRDGDNQFNGSPYDVFLIKNNLPRQPGTNETGIQYSRRLLQLVNALDNPQYVIDPDDGQFTTHHQSFQFGPAEMEGLKIFLTEGGSSEVSAKSKPPTDGRIGNCAVCHTPPAFTDFLFHNTGSTEEEYDAIHGKGTFQKLYVPDFFTRQMNYNAYLPPTPNHPYATGRFAAPTTRHRPRQIDLGLWNVFANPDFPAPQAGLQQILPNLIGSADPAVALPRTIALFKTPTLRDLGHSNPYLHTGRMNSIEEVITFYQNFSNKARQDDVRNAAPELRDISLDDSAVTPLAAFLRSLNEDYTD